MEGALIHVAEFEIGMGSMSEGEEGEEAEAAEGKESMQDRETVSDVVRVGVGVREEDRLRADLTTFPALFLTMGDGRLSRESWLGVVDDSESLSS